MRISTMPLHLRTLLLGTSALTGIALAPTAQAGQPGLPTGGVVTAGTATIAQPNASQLNITTGGQRTVIDWQSFSISSGNKVTIQQPGTNSITVNEVVGANPSQIFGDLASNGRVVLANPNGIWFGPGFPCRRGGLGRQHPRPCRTRRRRRSPPAAICRSTRPANPTPRSRTTAI